MFLNTVKRLRIMRTSEANGLGMYIAMPKEHTQPLLLLYYSKTLQKYSEVQGVLDPPNLKVVHFWRVRAI